MAKRAKSIIRAAHGKENPYFLMARATAQDRNLTFEARGLLAYILSKPDHWRVDAGDLSQQCKSDRVYRILKELMDAGYMERIHHRDKRGRITFVEYVAHELPLPQKPEVVQPEVDKPELAQPELANADSIDIRDSEKVQNLENTDSFAPDGATDETPSSKTKRNKTNNKTPRKPATPKPDRIPEALMTPMKNAIFAAFNHTDWKTLTSTETGLIQKTAKELIEAGYTPADVQGIYDYCNDNFDKFKARALSSNASDARKEGYLDTPATTPTDTPADTDDEAQREAARQRSMNRFSHMRNGATP